jgi:hypothetical protein
VNGGESISYGDLDRVSRFTAALRDAGMKPGDRVAMHMLDQADLVSAYPAIIAAGGIAIAVSTRATNDDLRHVLRLSGRSLSLPTATSRRFGRHGVECQIVSAPARSAVVARYGSALIEIAAADDDRPPQQSFVSSCGGSSSAASARAARGPGACTPGVGDRPANHSRRSWRYTARLDRLLSGLMTVPAQRLQRTEIVSVWIAFVLLDLVHNSRRA